jgi:hypothetical protein
MKRYINKTYKVILALGLVSTFGCEKNIDLRPTDLIDASAAYQTVADLEAGTIGSYSNISYENSLFIGSIMTDEVRWAVDNNSRNYGLPHKWQIDPGNGDVTSAWGNLYNVIDRVNRALAVADGLSGDQALKDRDKGELLAIRAFCHFELLRFYAPTYDAAALGVPIMLQSSVLGQPARNTFGETIAQVKADLAAAKSLIPASYTVADFTRFTRLAVSALQARVALYEKNYDDAITYSSDVIAAKPLATVAQYPSIWTDASTTEIVFALKRSSNTGYVGTLWRDTNNDVFFSPSYKEIDLFDKTADIRYNTFIKQDLTIASPREQWLVIKYPGQTATNKFNNVKVLRTSEMYLIRAEAYAAKNNITSGAADLNALRANRITGYTAQTFATTAALTDAVYTERMKELFCEGHRFFDIRRRNLTITRDDRDLVTGTSIPKILTPTDRNYQLPIPQAEIFANKSILQNPNYR